MQRNRVQRLRKSIFNETGQMSVFIALIFQVLFVFFAMVINIGLVVHDKINLQNAVDLGVYYAAQRQAEILNEIAHINYQIRQDYKLLAWRYRVLGTLGRVGDTGTLNWNFVPPNRRLPGMALTERAWINPSYPPDDPPSICMAHDLLAELASSAANPNQVGGRCHKRYGQAANLIPDPPTSWAGGGFVGAFFAGLLGGANDAILQAQQQQLDDFAYATTINWYFTAQMLYAYKSSILVRKRMIRALRDRLLSDEMLDINGESIREGVEKTIKKNLTQSNLSSFDGDSFQVINGFQQGGQGCDNGDFVIPENLTRVLLLWTHVDRDNGTATPQSHTRFNTLIPQATLNQYDPSGKLRGYATGEATDDTHSSLGFEKNPWCLAYVGVKAKTQPRKPFSPFGSAVEMTARAFAQPFGGRIGPWYSSAWVRGAGHSEDNEVLRVDRLTTPRIQLGVPPPSMATNSVWLPNYSRYPGDGLGLRSEIALGAQRHIFGRIKGYPAAQRLSPRHYVFYNALASYGDPLAWDPYQPAQNQPAQIVRDLRTAEISAIAPDLFDTMYYSIDPDYQSAYGDLNANPTRFNLGVLDGIQVKPPVDMGIRLGNNEFARFNVSAQIAQNTASGIDSTLISPTITFYVLRNWQHLLTGWAPNALQDFSFPTEDFASCAPSAEATKAPFIPGRCRWGGRVGYSVRLISRDYLRSNRFNVGGEGVGRAAILNPPPEDF